jgi:hypothetical protein
MERMTMRNPAVIVIEVTWMRRKGKPVECITLMTGGFFMGLLVAQDVAKQLKVPQSWVMPVYYDNLKHSKFRADRKILLDKYRAAKAELEPTK